MGDEARFCLVDVFHKGFCVVPYATSNRPLPASLTASLKTCS
jgi:hypothetical protein